MKLLRINNKTKCNLINLKYRSNLIELQNQYKYNWLQPAHDNNNDSLTCKYKLPKTAMDSNILNHIQSESVYKINNEKHQKYRASMQNQITQPTQKYSQLNRTYLSNNESRINKCNFLNNFKINTQKQFDELNDKYNTANKVNLLNYG